MCALNKKGSDLCALNKASELCALNKDSELCALNKKDSELCALNKKDNVVCLGHIESYCLQYHVNYQPRYELGTRLGMRPRHGNEITIWIGDETIAMRPRHGLGTRPRYGLETRLGMRPRYGLETRLGLRPRYGNAITIWAGNETRNKTA